MRKTLGWILIGLIFLVGNVYAGETLEQVLAKNYKARGGLEKLKGIKTIYLEGKMTIEAAQSMEIPVKMWIKKPNKIRTETVIQGQTIVQAFDGEKAWWIMPLMGSKEPQLMPEMQAKQIKEQSESWDPLVNYKKLGYKLEYLGKDEIEGTEVYKLKLTKKDGSVSYHYLDVESGIEIMTETYMKRGETEYKVETVFGDYKEVNGIMFPFYFESKANGKTVSLMTFNKIEVNPEIDDSIFTMPASSKNKK